MIDDLEKRIAGVVSHPAMFSATPESAHGEMVALLAIWLASRRGISLEQGYALVYSAMAAATSHIQREKSQKSMLCDVQSAPEHVVTFNAFRVNCEKLLRELNAECLLDLVVCDG